MVSVCWYIESFALVPFQSQYRTVQYNYIDATEKSGHTACENKETKDKNQRQYQDERGNGVKVNVNLVHIEIIVIILLLLRLS